jgi:hypothetical protein
MRHWIIIYQSNLLNDDDTILYFIDFHIDIQLFIDNGIFSGKIIQGVIDIQKRYDKIYNPGNVSVELAFAVPFETVVKPNLFLCHTNHLVLEKVKQLRDLPIFEFLKEGYKIKLWLIDEKVEIDKKVIANIRTSPVLTGK